MSSDDVQNSEILLRLPDKRASNLKESKYFVIDGQLLVYFSENQIYLRKLDDSVLTDCQLKCKDNKVPICAAISPNQAYICAAYEDGDVVKFELPENWKNEIQGKSLQAFEKPINSINFIKNDEILVSNSKSVFKPAFSVMKQLGFMKKLGQASKKDTLLTLEDEEIVKMLVPPVYQLGELQFKGFENTFVLLTPRKAKFYNITKNKCECTYEVPCNSCFAFGSVSEKTISFMTVTKIEGSEKMQGNIFTYPTSQEPTFTFEISINPTFVTFLADSIIAAVEVSTDETKPSRAILALIGEKMQIETTIDYAESYACSSNVIYSIYKTCLKRNQLVSFEERMTDLASNNKFNEACDLCLKAYNGDPWCIIGLPPNADYRRLRIERQLATSLVEKIRADLSDSLKAKKIIEDIIERWKTMSMRNAVTDEFLDAFDKADQLNVYFNAVVKADPTATIFLYKKNFTQKLFETDGVEANDFILRLPDKIAPPAAILKYACKHNNVDLMFQVYKTKLNNLINSLTVAANNNQYDLALDLLIESMNEKAEQGIKWLLAISKGPDPFPRFTKIVQQDSTKVASLIDTIMNKIKPDGRPITPSQFTNALVISMDKANLESKNPLFNCVFDIVTNNNITLTDAALNSLIPKIFRSQEDAESFRPLLHAITQMESVSRTFLEKIIPLCDAYSFFDVKAVILMNLKEYRQLISFDISCGLDVFKDINNILKISQSSNDLEVAIIENATILVSKDVDMLLTIILKEFPSIKLSIVEHMSDSVKNYYIRNLLSKDPTVELDNELSSKYCKFLCKYYPTDVRDFVLKCKDINALSKTCQDHEIFDACAVIAATLNNFKLFKEYILKYFAEMSLGYIDGKDSAEVFAKNSSFICSMFNKYKQADARKEGETGFLQDAICEIVKNYAIPIYAANESGIELKPVQQGLHDICVIGYSFVTFEKLLTTIIGEYGELSLKLIRSTLIELVKDYSYDVDTSSSLAQLVTENESEAYMKYVNAATKGIEFKSKDCDKCHKRFTGTMFTTIYPCGHIFHDSCTSTRTCPVCHPEKKLDDKAINKGETSSKTFLARLKRFDRDLEVHDETNEMFVNEELPVIEIDPSKFQSLE